MTTQPRNTKKLQEARSRLWFFTLNNYEKEDIENITQLHCKYIFQEEKGENGTPHLQGYIKFPEAKTLGSMKKNVSGRAHFEIPEKEIACIKYCQKLETRNGAIHCNNPKWLDDKNKSLFHTDRDEWIRREANIRTDEAEAEGLIKEFLGVVKGGFKW